MNFQQENFMITFLAKSRFQKFRVCNILPDFNLTVKLQHLIEIDYVKFVFWYLIVNKLICEQMRTAVYKYKLLFLVISQTDECVFAFTIHGIESPRLRGCFIRLGDSYGLWHRHPIWKKRMYLKVQKTEQYTVGPRYIREIGTKKWGLHIMNSHIKRPRLPIN